MNFEQQLQQWTAIDNQLKRLNEQTKQLREKRAALSNAIIKQAPTSTVKISDGTLKFVNTRVVEPLTFKYLEKALAGIIKNEQHVKHILDHIKANREITIVPEIKRS
jgi:uncharacterized protein